MHLIDCERIFCYRALFFVRSNQNTNLIGFDQDEFVQLSRANSRSKKSLLKEYSAVRKATISLFSSLNDLQMKKTGTANGKLISVRALERIIIGHEQHHLNIIKERYL